MTLEHPRKPRTTSDRRTRSEQWDPAVSDELRPVRLLRKYADVIDGIDLGDAAVGDRLELSPHDADVLIAEGWAEPDEGTGRLARLQRDRAIAADRSRGPHKKPGD